MNRAIDPKEPHLRQLPIPAKIVGDGLWAASLQAFAQEDAPHNVQTPRAAVE